MKSLNQEFKITSAQVGYMTRWLAFQQTNKGFVGMSPEVVDSIMSDIKQCERWRDAIYKRKQKLGELKGQALSPHFPKVTMKHVEASVGAMCVNMLYIGDVWDAFQRRIGEFPIMPPGNKKAREQQELLEFEYDPEKYA